jgi:hypothetical protein
LLWYFDTEALINEHKVFTFKAVAKVAWKVEEGLLRTGKGARGRKGAWRGIGLKRGGHNQCMIYAFMKCHKESH